MSYVFELLNFLLVVVCFTQGIKISLTLIKAKNPETLDIIRAAVEFAFGLEFLVKGIIK